MRAGRQRNANHFRAGLHQTPLGDVPVRSKTRRSPLIPQNRKGTTTRIQQTCMNKRMEQSSIVTAGTPLQQGGKLLPACRTTRIEFAPERRRIWRHSPTVMAMLTDNTINDCEQAFALYQECQASGSDDRICEVAAHRVAMCTKGYIGADSNNHE